MFPPVHRCRMSPFRLPVLHRVVNLACESKRPSGSSFNFQCIRACQVHANVRFERRLPAEAFRTSWENARIGKQTIVDAHVGLEIRSLAEAFSTALHVARARLERLALHLLRLDHFESVHGTVNCMK